MDTSRYHCAPIAQVKMMFEFQELRFMRAVSIMKNGKFELNALAALNFAHTSCKNHEPGVN
eukprot:1147008-Pelagomonas_calceolata.AAC.3